MARSLVVPVTAAIFLPAMSTKERMFDARVTTTPVDSTNTTLEKSTSFMRESVTVLAPHSMSALPPATAARRVCTVTGTHSIFRSCRPNCCSMDFATSRQKSIV